ITARVAAREKGVHPASIYRAVKEGRLKGSRSGHTILIHRQDLAAWVPIGHRPRADGKGRGPGSLAIDREAAGEEARRSQREKNQAAIELLRSWREEGGRRGEAEGIREPEEDIGWGRDGVR